MSLHFLRSRHGDVEGRERTVCIEDNKQTWLRTHRQWRSSQFLYSRNWHWTTFSFSSSHDWQFADEENQEEDEESGLVDDEEDVDEINHETLPKVVVRAHSPGKRAHRSLDCHHVRHIAKHDVSDHAIHGDWTHVCVYPLSDGEGGVKLCCNMSLKVFRTTKKVSLQVRHLHLGESMQTSGIQDRPMGYVWNMKVSQSVFADPLFVTILEVARGPHQDKGVVPKLTDVSSRVSCTQNTWGWLTRTLHCRNSKQMIRMCELVEVSRFLTTMRTMSRSLKSGKRSLSLKDR